MEDKGERSSFPSFWISPDVNLFDTPIRRKGNSKPKHKRCNSGKASPYQDQSSLLKLKSALKSTTRKQSPYSSYNFSKSTNRSSLCKLPKNATQTSKPKKKKVIKNLKKPNKVQEEKLRVLNKKDCTKAPKIFKNQIFSDIYDKNGNHDRVMDTFEVSQSKTRILEDSLVFDAKFIIDSNLETEFKNKADKNNFKQPQNSFLDVSGKNMRNNQIELFQKLNDLAAERNEEQDYSNLDNFQSSSNIALGSGEDYMQSELLQKINKLCERNEGDDVSGN